MKHIVSIAYRKPSLLNNLPNEHDDLDTFISKMSEDRLLKPLLIERKIDLKLYGELYYVGRDKITFTLNDREEFFIHFKRVDDGYFEFCGLSELIEVL